jgi:hypothetical protein
MRREDAEVHNVRKRILKHLRPIDISNSCIAYKDDCHYDKPPSIAYVRSLEEEIQELKVQLRQAKTQVWLSRVGDQIPPCGTEILIKCSPGRMKRESCHPRPLQVKRQDLKGLLTISPTEIEPSKWNQT